MFFREVLNEDLSCASYLIADGGEAVVVDPKWETEEYLDIYFRRSCKLIQARTRFKSSLAVLPLIDLSSNLTIEYPA